MESVIRTEYFTTVFENEKTGSIIQKVRLVEGDTSLPLLRENEIVKYDFVTVVGMMLPKTKKIQYNMRGTWTKHEKYGLQFKVKSFEEYIGNTKNAIIAYLSSGAIKGIGKGLAEKIYDKFGEESVSILKSEPKRLSEVKGISEAKAMEIAKNYMENGGMNVLSSFLIPCGFSKNLVTKIYAEIGENAIAKIKDNPYILCDIKDVSFQMADNLARTVGYDLNSIYRVKVGITEALKQIEGMGHTGCTANELLSKLKALLGYPLPSQEILNAASQEMIRSREVYVAKKGDQQLICRPVTYKTESTLASEFIYFSDVMDNVYFPDIDRDIEEEEKHLGIMFDEKQKAAVKMALENKVSILTGGPGTGKTCTLQLISSVYKKNYPKKEVLFLAPTNKAARRITETTGEFAETIHSALGIKEESYEPSELQTIEADFIVVDESSMVDLWLMNALIHWIKPSAQLLLSGDADQLPSVGCGAVFNDLIESNVVPLTRLEKIFRQAEKSTIIRNSKKIKKVMCDLEVGDDFKIYEEHSDKKVAELLLQLYKNALNQYNLEDIVCLLPAKKGEAGVYEMNKKIQQMVNPVKEGEKKMSSFGVDFHLNDIVMHLENEIDVSNGDVGKIIKLDRDKDGDYLLVRYYQDTIVKYHEDDLSKLTLAYTLTIHKSQGSQYKHVITALCSFHPLLLRTRNLFYTAITRAKDSVEIVGDKKSIVQSILTDGNKRITMLKEKLVYEYHKQTSYMENSNPFV